MGEENKTDATSEEKAPEENKLKAEELSVQLSEDELQVSGGRSRCTWSLRAKIKEKPADKSNPHSDSRAQRSHSDPITGSSHTLRLYSPDVLFHLGQLFRVGIWRILVVRTGERRMTFCPSRIICGSRMFHQQDIDGQMVRCMMRGPGSVLATQRRFAKEY